MRLIIVLIFCLVFSFLTGQEDQIMSFESYMNTVKENHPVMYQAKLLAAKAESNLKMAKGGFDPKFEAEWDHKSFDNKNYYSISNGSLKIPTWYGVNIKAGYDKNLGDFLNQSDIIPNRGLWSAGISVPLGKGLVIDNRRAELKKAKIFNNVTLQEQIVMTNKLLYEASLNYLEWQISQSYLRIAEEGLGLAKLRLEGSIKSFVNGDKPAIDTLESFISFQARQVDYQKTVQNLENAKIAINNYLWVNGEIPLEIVQGVKPDSINAEFLKIQCDSLTLRQDQWIDQHPELLLYDFNMKSIDIDVKLAKENFKPDLRLNYNPLISVADDALFDQFNPGNYKVGASFSYPIMQRKQRGKFELIKLKKKETEIKKLLKNQELLFKLDTYINNISSLKAQLDLLDETVDNYNNMLIAENRKLSVGESSIFLVNSRESKYLESNYKRIEAQRKLLFSRFTYLFIAARISDVI